jgi:hypothetical protein
MTIAHLHAITFSWGGCEFLRCVCVRTDGSNDRLDVANGVTKTLESSLEVVGFFFHLLLRTSARLNRISPGEICFVQTRTPKECL